MSSILDTMRIVPWSSKFDELMVFLYCDECPDFEQDLPAVLGGYYVRGLVEAVQAHLRESHPFSSEVVI